METRKEKAAEKKRCGSHNCTQAVLCTYHDFAGMEEETIKNVGNAFAAGMGNMEGTCGALVGAGIILGLATQDKAKSIKGMRQIMDKFKQRNGATQCKLLKGVWYFFESRRKLYVGRTQKQTACDRSLHSFCNVAAFMAL